MCLYPKLIKNRKYVANKKNSGNIPHMIDKRVEFVPVGCGNCMECRKKKAREWQVRLHEEIRHTKNGHFVTLTFSDEALIELDNAVCKEKKLYGYALENAIATKGTRRFLERWRKKHKKSVRHWLITELGHTNTERIHIHGIIFTDKPEEIEKHWKYGNVWIGDYVNERTINYVVKYVTKVDIKHKEYKSKILTSRGIGKQYLKRTDAERNIYKGKETNETYRTRQGIKLGLPIYYRNKLYTDEEREELWLDKLDEQIRYVNGQAVSVENGEDIYNKLVSEARKINRRLGYGKQANWVQKKYEEELRELKREKRKRK